jgi:pyruvate dehydrogenase E2 component (dihydrolipoamide acetyltransferase)
MSATVVMPRLSDSMEEGTVVRWLKQVGDGVAVGDELVEIETDKATMTYEADAAGTLLEILVREGETVALGVELARIGALGEAPASRSGQGSRAARSAPVQVLLPTAPRAAAPASAPPSADRINASPVARRIARELGLELALLAGSGPHGRIVKADVEAAAAGGGSSRLAPASEPPSARELPVASGARGDATMVDLTRLQQTVARRMAESKATIPDFTLFADVDMSACVDLRAQLKAAMDPAPSYNDLIVKASALALRAHGRANAGFRDGRFELYGRVNVGVAVAREGGLVVPTIFDADQKPLGQIARETARLAGAVRAGSVTPPELSGGTFTVSNLGMYGVSSFQAIVNPGQAAILSVGAMSKRAVVAEDGAIVARAVLTLGLICDHRILYGADAAQFLRQICDLLERPLAMAL